MASFKLGKEKAENVFRLVTSVARGIQRSEVRLVKGIQNFFFVPRSWQDEKHLPLFLYRAQNLPSPLIYL